MKHKKYISDRFPALLAAIFRSKFSLALVRAVYLLPLLGLASCVAFPKYEFVRTPEYRPGASIKVVSVRNDNDVVLGKTEHALLQAGIAVVADNQLRGALPVEETGISTADTSFTLTRYRTVGLELFPEQSADYLMRVQYDQAPSLSKWAFSSFSASVVDPSNGHTVASASFSQRPLGIGKRSADKVLRKMAGDLRR